MAKGRLLFIENQDSFSYLLADTFRRLGPEVDFVHSYAPYQPLFSGKKAYQGIVIGPGPGDEQSAPNLMQYVQEAVASGLPIVGICLGMQALGVYFGAELKEANLPVHGKVRALIPTPYSNLFPRGPEEVVRYHSLVLHNLPPALRPEAHGPEGECMALSHKTLPIWGVQYHPEAACTPGGLAFLARWLAFAKIEASALPLVQTVKQVPMLGAPALAF